MVLTDALVKCMSCGNIIGERVGGLIVMRIVVQPSGARGRRSREIIAAGCVIRCERCGTNNVLRGETEPVP